MPRLAVQAANRRFLVVTVVVLVLFTLLAHNPLFNSAEEILESVWYRMASEEIFEPRIAIIEIDEATLQAYGGRAPIGRDQIALLLAELASPSLDARTIVLDLYFEGQDPYSASHDQLLTAVLRQHGGRIVHALHVSMDASRSGPSSPPALGCLESLGYRVDNVEAPVASQAPLPLPELLCGYQHLGHIGVYMGSTRIPREIPMWTDVYGVRLAALSLEALRAYLGLSRSGVSYNGSRLQLGPYHIPADREGRSYLRFFSAESHFEHHSLLELWDKLNSHKLADGFFRDKIVLVGYNSPTYYPAEFSPTPFGHRRPSVYIHADMIAAILQDATLAAVPAPIQWTFYASVGACFFLMLSIRRTGLRLLAGLAVLASVLTADLALFSTSWILHATPALAAGAVLFLYSAFYSVKEQSSVIQEQGQLLTILRDKESSLAVLREELVVAQAVQRRLLPESPPLIANYELAGYNEAARDVGGDFFDFIVLPGNRVLITLGDVSGKGMPASLLMAVCQSLMRSESRLHLEAPSGLSDLFTSVNDALNSTIEMSRFVTVFAALLDSEKHTLEYCSAGHNPALSIQADESIHWLEASGMIMGPFQGAAFPSVRMGLEVGQVVILYSDGLVEAEDASGEQFQTDRLVQVARQCRHLRAQDQVEAIIAALKAYAGTNMNADDTTVVVVRRIG